MSKKNKNNNNPQTDEYGQLESMDGMNVVSDTEYTGMIPTPPGGCDDCTSYREIGDIPAPQPEIRDQSNRPTKKKNNR
ncbi:MAG: hypothetical protein IJM51_04410 [Clostridia bacterium]|nr:hypothetical protein [Clostridia bacterium]